MCSTSLCNGGDIDSIRGQDDCSKNPCPTGSVCYDTLQGFKCMCPPWEPSCTHSMNMPNNCPCQNGGMCKQLPTGNLGCSCGMGFTGQFCEFSKHSLLS
jgi:hypothetical protein